MAATSYLDFDMRIEREAGRYVARIDSPSGQAAHAFEAPLSDLELQLFIQAVSPARGTVRRADSLEMGFAKTLGEKLFGAVFAEEVRVCLRSSMDEAERQGAGLRIRLRLADAPELMNLPWEFMYHQDLNRFLSLSVYTPLVRYMDLPERIRPLDVRPPLRILAVIASPPGYPQLDVEAEWSQLRAALSETEE